VPGVAYLAYQAPSSAATPAPGTATPSPAAVSTPGTAAPPAAKVDNLFSPSDQNAPFAMEAQSYAPNMIGDFLDPTYVTVQHYIFITGPYATDSVSSPSGGFGRFKMADDTSPLPQDRVLVDNSYYGGALSADGAGGLTRQGIEGFEAGFEKTFLSGAASIEVRAPVSFDTTPGNRFGDLGVALKGLLVNRCDLAICAGMSMNVPTGQRVVTSGLDGTYSQSVVIENQSVHLLPFVGALWMPSCRTFVQGYLQVDVDAGGNQVLAGETGTPLTSVGRLYDPTMLYIDIGAGYWLRRGDCAKSITGIACIGEIHVNQSLAPGGVIGDVGVVPPTAPPTPINYSFVDLTVGAYLETGRNSNFTIGYVAPLTGGSDRFFDGELRAFYNYRF
jgi:hypothetical protein